MSQFVKKIFICKYFHSIKNILQIVNNTSDTVEGDGSICVFTGLWTKQ